MVPFSITYNGEFRCTSTHGPSQAQLATDAPKDNHGRGESFSPTDLAATSLATCIMTTMAIITRNDGIVLNGMQADVEKHMTSTPPRRIAKIVVNIKMPAGITAEARPRLERIAHQCPVALSLHPEVEQVLSLMYPD